MDLSPNQCVAVGSFVTSNDRSGLDEQFTELVSRQSRFVFRVAFSVVRNAHDAEDIVQDAFMKLYRTGAWKHMQDEKAFLARAAWRIAVERRVGRKTQSIQVDEALRVASDNPEERVLKADTHRLVHALIDALPEALRLPLALSALEELTSGQIAEIMNLSEGTVRSRLAKGRQVLRDKLERILGGRDARG